MDRKLASIQRIVSLSPIEGADKIEKAVVLGWELVVAKKDNFKVGDKVCYCEVDSILPDKPEFEFLRDRKFRIKTIKLKGQVSQGICFPLSILPKGNYKEGDDVTNLIGVRKYDPQAEFERKESDRLAAIDKNRLTKFFKRFAWYRRLFFKAKRIPFPAFIKKTDEDRIQLFPDYYERWGDLTFDVTEKVDGQSATYFMIPNKKIFPWDKKWKFGVCSRNFQLLKPDSSSYWTLAKELDIEKKMTVWCDDHETGIIIQGEAVGVGIQGNKYKFDKVSLFVFNVAYYHKGKRSYFNQYQQENFCKEMDLTPVPWLTAHFKLKPTIPEMVEYAKGYSLLNREIPREGIVVRNYANNVSFKVINTDFLLKYGE
ncbi:MAG: RNA ligase family protein [Candidatus Paceibacterota bacterium]|jgi:hypothetical protein